MARRPDPVGRPDIDLAFRALADGTRRRLLDSLNGRTGQTLRQLCADLDISRQSVSKHLALLEQANLVTSVRRGREKLHYLNPAPINDIAERWITRYHRSRVLALSDLRHALETATVNRPTFVYTSYIETTPERLFQALIDPTFTERYWGVALTSTWEVGATVTWELRGVTVADPSQVVLAFDPPHRLAYTWHSVTPELAEALGLDDPARAALAAESRSRVTFTIEPADSATKLTVVHEGFDPGSAMLEMITNGWPQVVSHLKTLLETGRGRPAVPAGA